MEEREKGMSSALKKKRRFNPKGYEDRGKMQQIQKNKTLSEKCFTEIFDSMQLINFTVLYAPTEDGGFDFTKKKLQNFNAILTRHNQEYDDGGLTSTAMEEKFKEKFDFDCKLEAKNFPYRPKMKMYGGKPKNMTEYNVALASINGAIETYLILAIHTLHENYRFNKDMIWKWWNKFKEYSELYVDGLTDEFIIKYFVDECGLKVNK